MIAEVTAPPDSGAIGCPVCLQMYVHEYKCPNKSLRLEEFKER